MAKNIRVSISMPPRASCICYTGLAAQPTTEPAAAQACLPSPDALPEPAAPQYLALYPQSLLRTRPGCICYTQPTSTAYPRASCSTNLDLQP